LEGAVEAERRKLFQDNPEIVAQQAEAYLYYVTCIILIRDVGLSSTQKIQELIKIRSAFQRKITEISVPDKYRELSELRRLLSEASIVDSSGLYDTLKANSWMRAAEYANGVLDLNYIDAMNSLLSDFTGAVLQLKSVTVYEEPNSVSKNFRSTANTNCPGVKPSKVIPFVYISNKQQEFTQKLDEFSDSLYIGPDISAQILELKRALREQTMNIGCEMSALQDELYRRYPATKDGKLRLKNELSGNPRVAGGPSWIFNALLSKVDKRGLMRAATSVRERTSSLVSQ
jgi:hypothetical protein